jgi:hypothetical protein
MRWIYIFHGVMLTDYSAANLNVAVCLCID